MKQVLYYKPQYESQILDLLVGPNFANGENKVKGMIDLIQSAMNFKLKEDQFYLSKQSRIWINKTLPKMKKEIGREIEKCKEALKG